MHVLLNLFYIKKKKKSQSACNIINNYCTEIYTFFVVFCKKKFNYSICHIHTVVHYIYFISFRNIQNHKQKPKFNKL